MTAMRTGTAVLCGGAAGAVCRSEMDEWITNGLALSFPIGILAVNVLGAFFMGLLAGAVSRSGKRMDTLFALLGTGFLGGFTTFSTFSLNTFALWLADAPVHAVVNVALHLLLGLPAAGIGYALSAPRHHASPRSEEDETS